ncbi:molybdopterin-dependent oxidoreductase [Paenarthrobacter sp. PH39-S1]|uniref:molybdopterin-dependent oxidoreductase n=1 Tax=Paenarthrobacter sp. PH39-S1 TaxID=3046204 RepID=UPI0024BBC206|nr:molybdopterin-dependent oxidoreductase [Paenarthrobacter sp. PH39-S1]MDJ0357290.1 molybdopterin-dependent oxidoreductase [Paenarthrobacter sp. PH39-S1]
MSIRTRSGLTGHGGLPGDAGGPGDGGGRGTPGGPSGTGGLGDTGRTGRTERRRLTRWAGACGLVAGALGVAAGELTAAAVSPSLSPITAVGGVAIDAMLPGVKDWAISLFGTSDKLAFLLAMCLVIAALAVLGGIVELRRKFTGLAGFAVFGIIGVVAVLTRAQSTTAAIAPPLVAAGLAVVFLTAFRNRLLEWMPRDALPGSTAAAGSSAPGRRKFLTSIGVGAAVAVVAGFAATVVRSTAIGIAQARANLVLPGPVTAVPPLPAGAALALPGIAPLVTPNADFYRIDTALVVPSVNPDSWTLTVNGMVDHEVEIDLKTLLAKPLMENYTTLACVSNEVGGDLVGNAKWLGWPVRELLALAGVQPGADMVLSRSTDGFTAGTPLEAMTDARNAVIAVGMNGQPLPQEHGFPARLVVPGLYGFVSATKWVTSLTVTRFSDEKGYWSTRGWSDHGPIKTESRIDTPRDGTSLKTDTVAVGGVAWAPQKGISKVQVRVDQGEWQDAVLGGGISKDTWVQWTIRLSPGAGQHELQVRAFDGAGQPQTDQVAQVVPDGATGYHTITVHTS